MVHVTYVDGDTDNFETTNSIYAPWRWMPEERCFLIPDVDGDVIIPKDFIKSMKHINVEEK